MTGLQTTLLQGKQFLGNNIWILEVFVVVLLTLTARRVMTIMYRRIIPTLHKTNNFWDNSLLEALYKPLGLAIWVLGLSYAAQIAGSLAKQVIIFSAIPPLRALAFIFLAVWFLLRFIKIAEKNYVEAGSNDDEIDRTTIHAISQLLRVSVIITATLIGMQMFNVDITALLAFGSIGGAGIAFAAKDLLANFFGGVMIYMDRPFSVGDWIRSTDRQIEGTVEHIGWRLTCIRTFDKRPLYVPNGTFLTISVENPSRMTHRRIKTNIGVRYDDAAKVATITDDIKKMLREHPEIDNTQTMIVNLVEFGDSALSFMVYTFTKTTNWIKFQAVQEDVFLKIIAIITQLGAECAFPTRTLHVPTGLALTNKNEGEHDYPEAYTRSV